MKQYVLNVIQPDGNPPPPEVLAPIMRDVATLLAEMKSAGAWVFNGGLAPREHGHGRARQGRRGAHHRRPVRRGQGAHRRVHRSSTPPTSTRRSSGPARPPVRSPCRSRSVPSGSTADAEVESRVPPLPAGDRTCVPRAIRPRGLRPRPRLRRHRPRRRGGAGRLHRRSGEVADERAPSEPRGVDHHHGAEPHHRPAPPRVVARRPARSRRVLASRRRAGRGGPSWATTACD